MPFLSKATNIRQIFFSSIHIKNKSFVFDSQFKIDNQHRFMGYPKSMRDDAETEDNKEASLYIGIGGGFYLLVMWIAYFNKRTLKNK